MAYTQLPNTGPYLPSIPDGVKGATASPGFTSTLLIDATGEKIAFCGRVWWPNRQATRNIRRVGFLFGTIVKAGGSALTISLQDVNLAAGPPIQPDGTQDQTVAITNADAAFATDTWYRSGVLSVDRSVAFGELLSVVLEYDGAGRLGVDSVILKGLTADVAGHHHQASSVLFTTGWTVVTVTPNIILEFDDGTFGTLSGSFPCSALGTIAYNSGSTPDENCLEGSFPFPCKVDGALIPFLPGAGGAAAADIVAYDGTTAITNGTVSIDPQAVEATNTQRQLDVTFGAELTFAANTIYRLAVKPTTVNNVTVYFFDVADANHLTCHDGGIAFVLNSRTDAGAWGTATATRRIFGGWRISSLDDGVGGSTIAVSTVQANIIQGVGIVGY